MRPPMRRSSSTRDVRSAPRSSPWHPSLRFVQMIGAGTDPLDLAALAEAGVVAAYNPGVNRTGAAEQTIMLMLALIKRQPQSERQTRAGRFAPGGDHRRRHRRPGRCDRRDRRHGAHRPSRRANGSSHSAAG